MDHIALSTERRVALIIGNSNYKTLGALQNPVHDAELVATALRQVGFDAVLLKINLNHEKFYRAIRNFVREARRAHWAMVYFAGHGIETNGENYLLPIDANLNDERDINWQGVPLAQILRAVDQANCLRLVVLDACRTNRFSQQMMRGSSATRSAIGGGLGFVEPDPGTLVVYAAKHGSVALDGDGSTSSPFTTAFVKYLVQPGLEVEKLFRFVRDDVATATRNCQVPWKYGSLPPEDFFFVRPEHHGIIEQFPKTAIIGGGTPTLTRGLTENALTTKRITDPEDDDLFSIWELQAREFSEETADPYDEMQRWIGEIDENYAQDSRNKFDDIMLALKLQDDVVGYLYAQHYVNHQIIFISYLGYDFGVPEARRNGATELLKKLLEVTERSSPPWKAMVAEVEQFKHGRRNHSHDLFVTFKRYERKLKGMATTQGKLFMLDFDYIQPAVSPAEVGAEGSDSPSLIQKILFFARDIEALSKSASGEYYLSGEQAINLFDAVISCVYGDAYRDDETYQEYLRSIQASYRSRLEKGVRLIDR